MSNASANNGGPEKQQMVYFDIGGHRYPLLRETVENYPQSKLAELVREFPSQGSSYSNPLYVDRDPKTFKWIREIYRVGDYESCTPPMSWRALQNELNFYQLPTLSELGYRMESVPFPNWYCQQHTSCIPDNQYQHFDDT